MTVFNQIDRFVESKDSKLANITHILFEKLGCRNESTKDYIMQKLQEIVNYDIQEEWDCQP